MSQTIYVAARQAGQGLHLLYAYQSWAIATLLLHKTIPYVVVMVLMGLTVKLLIPLSPVLGPLEAIGHTP